MINMWHLKNSNLCKYCILFYCSVEWLFNWQDEYSSVATKMSRWNELYSCRNAAAAANGGICLAFAVCLSRKCTFMYELSSHSFDPYFSSIFSLSKWGTKLGDFKKMCRSTFHHMKCSCNAGFSWKYISVIDHYSFKFCNRKYLLKRERCY